MVGKFLVGRKTTQNGMPVTMICGVVSGHHVVDNDTFNAVLLELEVKDQRIANPDIEEYSPEDFLEFGINEIDWTKK